MTSPLHPAMCPFTLNPWHGVSPGKNAPVLVNAIIEIPKDSKVKYEIDKASGLLKLDRVLFSAVHYPANYGFIPQTYCDDHDPLDILVLCSNYVAPLTIVEARVVGVMNMTDQGEMDDKIIAVANNDVSLKNINSLEELPPHLIMMVHRFFEDYKKLEDKEVLIKEFMPKEIAYKIIEESIRLYDITFRPQLEPLSKNLIIPAQIEQEMFQ